MSGAMHDAIESKLIMIQSTMPFWIWKKYHVSTPMSDLICWINSSGMFGQLYLSLIEHMHHDVITDKNAETCFFIALSIIF